MTSVAPSVVELPARSHTSHHLRAKVDGKFLRVDGGRFWVKGVTYGTFAPDAHGHQFPVREVVARDFAAMAAHGINTVRTYTSPQRWLLDEAAQAGLRVMVGLPWTQHIAFKTKDMDTMNKARRNLEAAGVEVLGPTDHTIFQSIYFRDPSGHRLELACDMGTPEQWKQMRDVAHAMIDEWAVTKKPPRHTAWLHTAELGTG